MVPNRKSRIEDTDFIKPEFYKLYRESIDRPRNFFKHANRDPEGVLDFESEYAPFVIHDCARMYARLTGRVLREGAEGLAATKRIVAALRAGQSGDETAAWTSDRRLPPLTAGPWGAAEWTMTCQRCGEDNPDGARFSNGRLRREAR